MICTAAGGRKKESLNGLLDTVTRGRNRQRICHSLFLWEMPERTK